MIVCAGVILFPLSAQALDKPSPTPEIINFCQSPEAEGPLSDCLVRETIGHAMLIAVTEEFIGQEAEPAIDACRELNTTQLATWNCFSGALRDAVEAAELIGKDTIKDPCLQGIAVPKRVKNHLDIRFDDLLQTFGRKKISHQFDFSTVSFKGCMSPQEVTSIAEFTMDDIPSVEHGSLRVFGMDEILEQRADILEPAMRKDYCNALEVAKIHLSAMSSDTASKFRAQGEDIRDHLPEEYFEAVKSIKDWDMQYAIFFGLWSEHVIKEYHPEHANIAKMEAVPMPTIYKIMMLDRQRHC